MPLALKMGDQEVAHVTRILSAFQGPLRLEMLRSLEDRATMLARIKVLEDAARPIADLDGKHGEKWVRVPFDVHMRLVDAVKA